MENIKCIVGSLKIGDISIEPGTSRDRGKYNIELRFDIDDANGYGLYGVDREDAETLLGILDKYNPRVPERTSWLLYFYIGDKPPINVSVERYRTVDDELRWKAYAWRRILNGEFESAERPNEDGFLRAAYECLANICEWEGDSHFRSVADAFSEAGGQQLETL